VERALPFGKRRAGWPACRQHYDGLAGEGARATRLAPKLVQVKELFTF